MQQKKGIENNQSQPDEADQELLDGYWRANLRLVAFCLSIWFAVSFGCGILFVDALNQVTIGGFKLGFWFAQQGSIYCFLVLVFYYARRMNQLDKAYQVEE